MFEGVDEPLVSVITRPIQHLQHAHVVIQNLLLRPTIVRSKCCCERNEKTERIERIVPRPAHYCPPLLFPPHHYPQAGPHLSTALAAKLALLSPHPPPFLLQYCFPSRCPEHLQWHLCCLCWQLLHRRELLIRYLELVGLLLRCRGSPKRGHLQALHGAAQHVLQVYVRSEQSRQNSNGTGNRSNRCSPD